MPTLAHAWNTLVRPATLVTIFICREKGGTGFSSEKMERIITDFQELWTAACELGEDQQEKLDCNNLGVVIQVVG